MAQLSYSSMKTLSACEMKYHFYKIQSIPKDPDAVESDALGVGKAFHEYLEDVLHGEKFNKDTFEQQIIDKSLQHNVRSEAPLIAAMALCYMRLHKASGLTVVTCELPIETPKFKGFIDVILKDSEGNWWIGDLKTAAKFDQAKVAQLPKDQQLNLYSHFAKDIAPHIGLDPEKFKGCRYRVTLKTRSALKSGESVVEFAKRMVERGSVESFDAIIPVEMMAIEATWKHFQAMHERATELEAGVAPNKNLENCMSYFRPCEYWSRCHGKCFSQMVETPEVVVMTEQKFKDLEML